jgi:alpha-tubulin suppressor-like RCC1 family protein
MSASACAIITLVLAGLGSLGCSSSGTGGQVTDGSAAQSDAGSTSGTANTALPCSDSDALKVKAIALGDAHVCALTATGGVRCWGDDEYGQLGTPYVAVNGKDYTSGDVPPSTDVLEGVQAIAAQAGHTCALMNTGGVRCWGSNESAAGPHEVFGAD